MSHEKIITSTHILLLISFHLFPLAISTNNSSAILYEILPFIRVYTDGRVERLLCTETVPPSLDPSTKVQSKDVSISPLVSARVYLPQNANPTHKLPLLVYFHGGAFCTESPFTPEYHNLLNSLVAEANIVAVSVNYRLAPENPLPGGYQDSWTALKWVFSHGESKGNDVWLENYVDFKHVYLAGDSAGGNIAHNVAMRIGLENEPDNHGVIEIEGMFLSCPHFWGEKSIGNEDADIKQKAEMESIWIHAYPNSTSFDDPSLNPGMDPNLGKLGGKRVLVYVAEEDILRERGWYYGEALRKSKWTGSVKVVEVKGEGHVFNIRFPHKPKAIEMLKQLASFLNQGKVLKYHSLDDGVVNFTI